MNNFKSQDNTIHFMFVEGGGTEDLNSRVFVPGKDTRDASGDLPEGIATMDHDVLGLLHQVPNSGVREVSESHIIEDEGVGPLW